MTPRRVPEWLVERLHAGDLPADEAVRVRAELEREEGGLARLARLADDDRAFEAAHPPGPALGRIRRAARPPEPARSARRRFLLLAPALAGAAAAALFAVRVGDGLLEDGTRTKGGRAHLVVHRQRPGVDAEPLRDGARARPGDLVQLSYVAADARYGVVLSIDGRGLVTLHLPESGGDAAPLAPGGAVALPHAYLLDDAPAFERFVLVASARPFRADAALAAARALTAEGRAREGALALPEGLSATSFVLQKESR